MEKTLLRSKKVLDGGIIVNKWYCTNKILNHPNNKGKNIDFGWNIMGDGICSPACPPGDAHGIYECIGGQCVYIPY